VSAVLQQDQAVGILFDCAPIQAGATCIDCHRGIVHKLPQ